MIVFIWSTAVMKPYLAKYPESSVLSLVIVPVIPRGHHIGAVGLVPGGHNEGVLLQVHPNHPPIRSMARLSVEKSGVGVPALETSTSIM